ncbi:MAG: hypothetical protein IPF99_09285 [Deltaproteobacteria bacterium]|nr:hypothetical protein [Deltaproteobacteria bacterium]
MTTAAGRDVDPTPWMSTFACASAHTLTPSLSRRRAEARDDASSAFTHLSRERDVLDRPRRSSTSAFTGACLSLATSTVREVSARSPGPAARDEDARPVPPHGNTGGATASPIARL